jgi:DNA adenine methylase
MFDSINSPFRYAGGKFYARKPILAHMAGHTAYVEPFAGGGSVFFAKSKAAFNHLNDIDTEIINVYTTIRDNPTALIEFLVKRPFETSRVPEKYSSDVRYGEPLPATKELHGFFKNEFNPVNELEAAGKWFYLNRTSYSGIMNPKNMYWGYGDKFSMQPKNWPRNIMRTCDKLQGVKLTSMDFEEVIDNAPDRALLFIDPPYYSADQEKFYRHHFNLNDHIRLVECLLRNRDRLKLFVTYDNVDPVRVLYSWMDEMHDMEWNYCIQRTDDQKNGTDRKGERPKGKELFLLNYSTSVINEKSRPPVAERG